LFAVARRLRLIERPRLGVLLELGDHLFGQRLRPVADRVAAVGVQVLVGVGVESGLPHTAPGLERLHAVDVSSAPDALGLAGRKADHVGLVVERPPDAVDPSIAERLVHGLFPRDGRLACRLLVVTHPEHGLLFMVLFQPRAEVRRGREEGGGD